MAQVERDDLWQAIYEASPYNAPVPCEHFAHRQQGGWDVCAECEADGIYEAVIKHLTEADRLLPPGGKVSTEWAIDRGRLGILVVGMGDGSEILARAARAAADRGDGVLVSRQVVTWGEIGLHTPTYVGPWSPVVSDTSGAPDSGEGAAA